MNFFKNIISSAVGFVIAIALIFLLIVLFTSVLSEDSIAKVQEESLLRIELSTELKDYAPLQIDPFSEVLGLPAKYIDLNEIIRAIESAASDDRIKGITIECTDISAGISQLGVIREAILKFKSSGKPVFAYSDSYEQKEYFLSSVADSLFVSPSGQVDLRGLSSEVLFFKDFQDKYGLKMEVIRHGKYKGAVEPFIANKMSESNRVQIKELLNSMWSSISNLISVSRGVSNVDINLIADNLLGRTAHSSLENSLVDGVLYIDEYQRKIEKTTSIEKYNTTELLSYIKLMRTFDINKDDKKSKIAVIYAQGDIIYGEGDEDKIGQGMMVKAIDRAANNKSVKAIVLRVNSPGGSALASDLIWRSLEMAKKKKPLVVSMGNYAASGGYYIACNADRIFAEPTTVTGSIGVFGILPNVSDFANEIGIHSEKVSTNKSPTYSPFAKLDSEFREVTKQGIDQVYTTFVTKVAQGRGMSYDAVDNLAQGRVWSGKQAQINGLVDNIGGLDAAIASAASLVEIDNYEIENYPNYDKDIRDSFKNMSFSNLKEYVLKEWLGDSSFNLFEQLNSIKHKEGIQMALPYALEIN